MRSSLAIAIAFGAAVCRAQSSLPSITGVASAAAYGQLNAVAPGSWIEIYGANLASATRGWATADFVGNNAPTSLGGTSVTIGGQPAFLDYISPGQVNAQAPSGVGIGSQPVIVTTAAGASAGYMITVNAASPGLLSPASFNLGGIQYLTALFQDGATYALPPGAISGVLSQRPSPGDVLTFYGIGFGAVSPSIPPGEIAQQSNSLASPFHIFFGSSEATASYAGLAPGTVGLYQFNVTVPDVSPNDAVPISFTLAGVAGTQKFVLPVQAAAATPQLQSLTLSSSSGSGGDAMQGTVVLTAPAPAGGATVSLSSSSSAATVPSSLTIPAASTSATFDITTIPVAANQSVTITASYNGASVQSTFTLTPLDLTGTWTGSFSENGGGGGSWTWQLTQTGTKVNGTVANQSQVTFSGASLSGTLTDGILEFQFSATAGNGFQSCTFSFTGSTDMLSNDSMSGSWSDTLSCGGANSGAFQLYRKVAQPAVAR